jgi:hypothetical protein
MNTKQLAVSLIFRPLYALQTAVESNEACVGTKAGLVTLDRSVLLLLRFEMRTVQPLP